MPVDVRVQRPGTAVLQLDDLDPVQRLPDASTGAAPRVQLVLPRRDDPIPKPILQRLKLRRKLRTDQRGDAVRLRRVDRSVQDQIRRRRHQLTTSDLAGDRVAPVDPTPQLLPAERVDADLAGDHGEPGRMRSVATAVSGERLDTGHAPQVRIARRLERVRHRLSNPLRLNTPLPTLETSTHATRVLTSCLTRYEFHRKCLRALLFRCLGRRSVDGARQPAPWSLVARVGRLREPLRVRLLSGHVLSPGVFGRSTVVSWPTATVTRVPRTSGPCYERCPPRPPRAVRSECAFELDTGCGPRGSPLTVGPQAAREGQYVYPTKRLLLPRLHDWHSVCRFS